jgi:hypothetical protein
VALRVRSTVTIIMLALMAGVLAAVGAYEWRSDSGRRIESWEAITQEGEGR